MSEKELKELKRIFDKIDLELLDNDMISEENLSKSVDKITPKQAKKFDKIMGDICSKVALSAYKLIAVMALAPQIKMTNITFEREGDGIKIKLSVGAVEYHDGEGNKFVFNPALVKSIESEGGIDSDKEES